MIKKRSVFVRSAIIFAISYFLYLCAFLTYDFDRSYRLDWPKWIASAGLYAQMGDVLLSQGNLTDLDTRLALGIANYDIHFYIIRENGADFIYSNTAGPRDALQLAYQPGTYETDNIRYIVVHQGDYDLIVGHKVSRSAYAQYYWDNKGKVQLLDFFGEIFAFVVLVLFSFRDLREVLRRISARGATRGDLAVARSSETLTLIKGLSGFESQAQALKDEKNAFRSQVLPALRRELESGKAPPYEFGCTLVRTDINNFTQTFMSDKRAEFMTSINDFFVGVTHLVSRYNGSVYEFVGDEVLFYFKDGESDNSSATAIAALRDIHKLAQKLNEQTEERGYSFKIKSSVAHGLLRFGPLVDAHALAGPPLIETVRMLSHVHEKSENTVLFDESLSDVVADLCRSKRQQVVMLKGLQGARALVTLEAFTPLSLHLRQEGKGIKFAQYYREDDDICEILNFVKAQFGKADSGELNQLVSLFRKYKVARASTEVKRAYVDTLNALSVAHEEKDVYLYASLVSAADHILTEKEWNGEIRAALFECLKHPNRRVVANALDIFANFEPEAGEKIFNELAKSGDNRIEANSLIKEAKREWKRKTALWMKTMMKTPSPYSKASAVYALGEIAKHFRETDPVAFAANSDLQSLLEMIPKLTEHANAMVRRQALAAAGKAGLAQAGVALAEEATDAEAEEASKNVVPLRKIG